MAATVTVACKYPPGIIMRAGQFVTRQVPVLGGGMRDEKVWQASNKRVEIKGPRRGVTGGDDPASPNNDGYALTFGVDADIVAQWMKDNADSDLVLNGLVIVHGDMKEIKAQTKAGRDQKTGLEPLSPSGDTRVPKNVSRVTEKAA